MRRTRDSFWLGGRDSNPDSQIQSLESYHWTTSQQGILNLRIVAPLVKRPLPRGGIGVPQRGRMFIAVASR